jgi:hypothetical protein
MELRVWYITNPPSEPVFVPVSSPKEAIKVINEEANRQLKDPSIWGNAFGLEEPETNPELITLYGGWTEWTHPDLGVEIGEYEQMMELGEVKEVGA